MTVWGPQRSLLGIRNPPKGEVHHSFLAEVASRSPQTEVEDHSQLRVAGHSLLKGAVGRLKEVRNS